MLILFFQEQLLLTSRNNLYNFLFDSFFMISFGRSSQIAKSI